MGFFPGFDVWDEIGEVYKLKKPGCICGGLQEIVGIDHICDKCSILMLQFLNECILLEGL